MTFLKTLLLLTICVTFVLSRTKEEWKSRTIYQLLTDRFAKGDGSKGGCNLSNYCGGDFKGILRNLDYIKSI
jgi:alpha-amylase